MFKLKKSVALSIATLMLLIGGCSESDNSSVANEDVKAPTKVEQNVVKDEVKQEDSVEENTDNENAVTSTVVTPESSTDSDMFKGYKIIEVDGGNLSGHREPNVAVNIGFGDREYWAFTNEHSQLVRVVAKEIILQDDSKEPVNSKGRYYNDEAKVPGVESKYLDEGHVIADSLGGVSNAYNITPQNSTLNRHGDQAYMEKAIRDAGGCTDFEAIITYPDTKTQIPSHYSYTYTLKGKVIHDEFDNVNPDEYNSNINSNTSSSNSNSSSTQSSSSTNNTQSSSSTNNTQSSNSNSVTVYWTQSGKKYHLDPNCSNMKNPSSGTIEESGREACKKCA